MGDPGHPDVRIRVHLVLRLQFFFQHSRLRVITHQGIVPTLQSITVVIDRQALATIMKGALVIVVKGALVTMKESLLIFVKGSLNLLVGVFVHQVDTTNAPSLL